MSGRPLRFLGMTVVGWVAMRAFLLWPTVGPAAIPRALVPAAFADNAPRLLVQPPKPAVPPAATRVAASPMTYHPRLRPGMTAIPTVESKQPVLAPTPPAAKSAALLSAQTARPNLLGPPPATSIVASSPTKRWSASAWFVLRDGRGIAPGLGTGQLGGSQAGLRVAYTLDPARRVAIYGRVASPLRGSGREAAIGVEWRPTRLPVRLVGEYRIALDGGKGGPATGIIAGTGPAPIALGFDLETYAQAGVIRRRRTEPFAEGAARLSRPVVKLAGIKFDLGVGGWGGAQRGVQRVDVGPSVGARAPLAGKSLRLSLEWRQRVAGHARPGSGPVLAIGSDF